MAGGGGSKRYNEWILQAIVNADMAVNMHFYALFEGVAWRMVMSFICEIISLASWVISRTKTRAVESQNSQTEVLWVVKPFTLTISSSFIVIRCISSLKEFVGITMCEFFPVYFGPPIIYKWVGFQVTRKTDDSRSWQAAILQSRCSVASSIK